MDGQTLLIVDDREDNLFVLRETLSEHLPEGRLLTASSAAEGLALLGEEEVDVALIDVQMPEMDGIEMCRQIKAEAATALVPVILITARDVSAVVKAEGLDAGAEDFISRPIDNSELVARTRAALRLKRAEDESRAGAALQWQSTFDAIRDGVMVLGADGVVLRCNTAMSELLGRAPAEILGRDCGEVVAEVGIVARARAVARLQRSLRRETTEQQTGDRWLATVVDPILGEDGELTGMVYTVRDMTERKRAEEAQRLAAVGQLAAGVAHEINNVLAIMSGRAQLAQAIRTDEEHEKLVASVLNACERGADICKNLTSFARPAEPKREALSVEDVIEATLAMAARELSNAGVTVQRSYEAHGKVVEADAGQIEQVLVNLIINSCHAMADGGTITVATSCAPGDTGEESVVVSVRDTGTGISPDHLARIFEPFYTTKGAMGNGDSPGVGLGLSVSEGIIRAHGGTISITSELGVGTTVKLHLPAHEGEVAIPDTTEPEPLPRAVSQRSGSRVLLAEDEPEIRDVVLAVLQSRGHKVITAASAPAAVSTLASVDVDLVVTDLLMPGGGGRSVIAAASELPDPPPVLVITGKVDAETTDEVLALGAAMCLSKPFGLAELVAAVSGLLPEDE